MTAPRPDALCGWCHVKLAALPEPPVPHGSGWYHQLCHRAVQIIGDHRRRYA